MNDIKHARIEIDLDAWEPFYKLVDKDIDEIVELIKTRKLLSHCGNVKTKFPERLSNG